MKFNGLQVGDKVQANGYPGTVTKLCEWSYDMIEVRLERGTICVPASEVISLTEIQNKLDNLGI